MKLSPQIPPHEQLHTIALKKGDVQTVARSLAFLHANRDAAQLTAEQAELVQDLFEFFKRVYQSQGSQ